MYGPTLRSITKVNQSQINQNQVDGTVTFLSDDKGDIYLLRGEVILGRNVNRLELEKHLGIVVPT